MESSVMPNNFATSNEIIYGAHYIQLVSDKVTYENNIGKFLMTYITPNMSSTEIYEKTFPRLNTGNVINKENLGITRVTNSNTIELEVPRHLFYIIDIDIVRNVYYSVDPPAFSCSPYARIIRKEYTKGQKFIIVNAGGEIDKPNIIGVV